MNYNQIDFLEKLMGLFKIFRQIMNESSLTDLYVKIKMIIEKTCACP